MRDPAIDPTQRQDQLQARQLSYVIIISKLFILRRVGARVLHYPVLRIIKGDLSIANQANTYV